MGHFRAPIQPEFNPCLSCRVPLVMDVNLDIKIKETSLHNPTEKYMNGPRMFEMPIKD